MLFRETGSSLRKGFKREGAEEGRKRSPLSGGAPAQLPIEKQQLHYKRKAAGMRPRQVLSYSYLAGYERPGANCPGVRGAGKLDAVRPQRHCRP